MSRLILHITTRPAWEAARAAGGYEAPSLATEGFIHLSDPEQVVRVAGARYSGVPELVLLCVASEGEAGFSLPSLSGRDLRR